MGVIDLEEDYRRVKIKRFSVLETLLRDRRETLDFLLDRPVSDTNRKIIDLNWKYYDQLVVGECKRIAAEYGDDGMPIN